MIQTPTKKGSQQANPFWEKFDLLQNKASEPEWLAGQRKAAIARFAEIGFPTLQDEDWRFTNVSPIAKLPFQPVLEPMGNAPDAATVRGLIFAGLESTKLVFVDGHYSEELSTRLPEAKGVIIQSLKSALDQNPELLEPHFGRHLDDKSNAFIALNTAFFRDGAFIQIPSETKLKGPIHLLHLSTGGDNGAASHIRHLVLAEKHSEATLLESYLSLGSTVTVTNTAIELLIGEGAHLEHCKFQDESPNSYHVASLHARIHSKANVAAHSFVLGAKIARNNIRTGLEGEGVECVLNGLYLTRAEQLADHHMIVEHAKPHCNSHEYFNGILDGRSKGVFHGRILVRPDAQKTDAKQTNKNLLLSDDASIDTKPQLEIYADDVKCTHGATIGQLNDESIFYLRARGIGEETAKRMLIHAFAGEIIDRVRYAPVREVLDGLIWDRLEQNTQIAMPNSASRS